MTDFATAFRAALTAKPKLSGREMRILKVLDEPPSKAKSRKLARIERRVRTEFGIGEKEAIDWSAIDWQALIQTVIKIIELILKFL